MGFQRLRLLLSSLVLTLLVIATPLAASFATEAHVGPNHGKAGPTLPAVATPSNVKEEKMVDWSFPAHLVKSEDWSSAVIAYQQLAWQVSGTAKIEALRQVGFAQEQNANHNAALQTYSNLLALPLVAESPSRTLEFASKAVVAALSRPSPTALIGGAIPAPGYFGTVMMHPDPANRWSNWALQTVAWQQLKTGGHLTQTYGIPQLASLQSDVTAWKTEQSARQTRTAALEMIPGLGLLSLNDKRASVGTFAIWLMALCFAVGTIRMRHYASATIWWGILALIMLSAPTLGAQRAAQLSQDQWPTHLQSLQAKYPNPRPIENAPQQISWIEDVPNSAVAQQPDYTAIQPAAGPTPSKP